MRLPLSFPLLLALAWGASGCEAPLSARLLEVHSVGPERIEPGARLRIEGAGFPVGRVGRARLSGTVRSPGAAPRRVRTEARGRSLSESMLEVVVTDALVESVGGRATFEGDLRVEFDAAEGGGVVAGVLSDVTLDFAPGTIVRLDHELDHRREADALLAFLGVTPSANDGGDEGIVVDGVVAGGPAADAGLHKGDRIVAIEGVRIAAIADLVPPPDARHAVLTVERSAEAGEITIRVPLEGRAGGPTPLAWIAGAVLVGLALALLLFLAPTARISAAVARTLARRSSASPVAPERERGTPPPRAARRGPGGVLARIGARARRAAWTALGGLAAVLALGVLPFTARVYTGGVDVGVLLFVAFAARLVIGTEEVPRRLGSSATGLAPKLGHFLVDGVPAAAAVGCIVVFGGTLRLAGIVAAQGGAPWEWYALRNPVAFVMFPVFVLAALAGARPAPGAPPATLVAVRMQRFVMAGLGTALFLGGWKLPFVEGDPLGEGALLRLAAAGVFIVKAWALSAISERVPVSDGRWRWAVPLALACFCIAATTLVAPWPPEVEGLGGPVLAALAVLLAIHIVARRRSGEPDARLHPFL